MNSLERALLFLLAVNFPLVAVLPTGWAQAVYLFAVWGVAILWSWRHEDEGKDPR